MVSTNQLVGLSQLSVILGQSSVCLSQSTGSGVPSWSSGGGGLEAALNFANFSRTYFHCFLCTSSQIVRAQSEGYLFKLLFLAAILSSPSPQA